MGLVEGLGPLLPFGIALGVLLVLQHLLVRTLLQLLYRLTQNVQLAMLIYALLIWPGTVVHEAAHWLAAQLLGVRATLPHLLPGRVDARGRMVLGHVRIQETDALRRALIGFAPLVVGSVAVALLARYAFALPIPDVEGVPGYAAASVSQLVFAIPTILGAPNAWLYLYALFAIANAMLPSESDREAWPAVLLFVAVAALLFYALVGLPALPAGATGWGERAAAWLTFAFVITALLDGALLLLLFPLERLLGRLGR